MKSTSNLAALIIVFAVALITVCPVTSRAADNAAGSRHESAPQGTAEECPIARPATAADCAGAGPGQPAATGAVTLRKEGDFRGGSGQYDAAGMLLEDLVKIGPEQDEAGL